MNCCFGESNQVEPFQVSEKPKSAFEKEDEEFSGPVKNRSCKDVFCLILFIVFCVVGSVYLIVAWLNSDADRLIHGYDSYGNVCGRKNQQLFNLPNSGQDKTNQPFFEMETQECVSSCSSSSEKIGFRCFPSIETENEDINGFFDRIWDSLDGFAEDLRNSWQHVLASCFVGLGLSVVVVLLLRFFAGPMIWTTLFLVAVGSVLGAIALWIVWSNNKTAKDSQWLLGGAIIVTVLAVVIVVILIALRNRIRLVIQLFIEAGKAVGAIPLLLLQPVWTLMFLVLVVFVWLVGWVGILSSGNFVQTENDEVRLQMNGVISGMRIYHFFGFLWVTQFVVACQSVTIAGAVATWYFSRIKTNLGSPILSSMSRLIRYHLGSVAFGSLVIAFVQLIQAFFKYIKTKVENSTGALRSFFCCCQCCLNCFESILKFINRNAYIEIAIYGHGFCKSAKMAFGLITNNILRVGTLNFVGDFVLTLCKLMIVASTVLIGREILKSNPNIDSMAPPLIVVGVVTYLITYCFLSVYEMTMDTLFLCFCEDCERNDGLQKPYYMSRGLMRFVENSKKALEALDNEKNRSAMDYKRLKRDSAIAIELPPNHQYPQSPTSAAPSEYLKKVGSPLKSSFGSGMEPLLPGYAPTSQPPSPTDVVPPGSP